MKITKELHCGRFLVWWQSVTVSKETGWHDATPPEVRPEGRFSRGISKQGNGWLCWFRSCPWLGELQSIKDVVHRAARYLTVTGKAAFVILCPAQTYQKALCP
jgi:hypothetical protein